MQNRLGMPTWPDSLPASLCVDSEVALEMLKAFPEPPVQVTQNYAPCRCNSGNNFSFCW